MRSKRFSQTLPVRLAAGLRAIPRQAFLVRRRAYHASAQLAIALVLTMGLLVHVAEAQSSKDRMLLINLDPLAIPIVVEGKIRGKITISLKLYLLDPEVEKDVRKLTPKLKDTYLNYMYRYGASTSARGVLKLNVIMDQFQQMADKQFGKDKIKVLVHSVEHSRKSR